MYALQTVHADIRGTTGRMLLFEYSLDNTWTYKVVIKQLGKNHWTYAPWLNVRCFSRPINNTLPLTHSHHFQNTSRQPKCFQSVSKCL
jgi:hypothetical protein